MAKTRIILAERGVTTNPRPTRGLYMASKKKNKYFILTTGTWQKQE